MHYGCQIAKSLELRTSLSTISCKKLRTVASPQVPVVSQPENSGCLDRTSDVSQSYQLQETETVAST